MAAHPSGSDTRPTLLLRIRDAGDAEAWGTFVDVYGPLIYRHCRGKGLQDADAAEVTQEVLLQVSRSVRTFDYDPEHGRFRDWLGTVTRGKLCRFLKTKAGAAHTAGTAADAEALHGLASPEQDTHWTEAFHAHLLQTALARVRPHFEDRTWRAFAGVWLENRAAADVARELGQKVGWVYVAKARVLKRLQAEVQQLGEDSAGFFR